MIANIKQASINCSLVFVLGPDNGLIGGGKAAIRVIAARIGHDSADVNGRK
jgi:hypothetical protein